MQSPEYHPTFDALFSAVCLPWSQYLPVPLVDIGIVGDELIGTSSVQMLNQIVALKVESTLVASSRWLPARQDQNLLCGRQQQDLELASVSAVAAHIAVRLHAADRYFSSLVSRIG